ncbi:MAG TPA: mechanosensitive ion channel family protein [Anaeromyxobacter sp.]|nr:mechanosensitive ion channel family protein [Anaeromyxobacter sp.]
MDAIRGTLALAGVAAALFGLPALAAELEEDAARPPRAPVEVRGQVLFEVQAPTGRLPVPDRAARIQQRAAEAVRAGRRGSDVSIEERAGASDVYAGPDFVFSVWDEDAARAGMPRQVLAAERADALRRALDGAAAETRPRSLLRAAARVAAATAGLVLFLVVTRFLVRQARLRTARLYRRRLRQLRRGVPGLSAMHLGTLGRRTLRLLGLAAAVVAVVAWVEFTLSQVPWTRGAARTAFRFAWDAVLTVLGRIAEYAPNAFYILLIVILTRVVLRVVRAGFRELEIGHITLSGFHADWARPTFNIVRVLVVALAAVSIFPYLPGSGSPAFQSISIFVGVLVSLGSSSAVANAIAGVILTYMRPFAVGDRIRSGDAEGMVLEKNLLVVRLRTDKNEEVTLPNATVLGAHVVNFSALARRDGYLVHTAVTIGYAEPWRKVHALLLAAARGSPGLEEAPAPFVLQTALDDFYVRYELNAHCRVPERLPAVLAAVHERIQDQFAAAGVEIMSPHYTALRDGHAIAFPEAFHPPGAEPGRFRVETIEAPRAADAGEPRPQERKRGA